MSQPSTPKESNDVASVSPGTSPMPVDTPEATSNAKYLATRAELNVARSRIQDLEAELADFSSQVMQEANKQVGDANRNVASFKTKNEALRKQISERDILIESQKEQLDVLKQMITEMDPGEGEMEIKTTVKVDTESSSSLESALEYAVWSAPVAPSFRYDGYEYEQFLRIKVPVDDEQWFKKTLSSWKFAAATIEHEVEPLLNISNAPHMSWLARRAFSAAVQDGSLEIVPIKANENVWATRPSHPCCFCGRNSNQPQYARLHTIRIPKDQQTYPVGNECVIRVRFACEYLGFLRSIFSGLRKLETKEAQQSAWAECTRLRQQLFWARVGGFWALAQTDANKNGYLTLDALTGESFNDYGRGDESQDEAELLDAPDNLQEQAASEAAAAPEKVGYPTQIDATILAQTP